ncbi:hypothetical protein J6590_062134 [Homalodisca vitripennis]|nr:hypothetical protein J6590_062134 [Homalodisca vitripennis]
MADSWLNMSRVKWRRDTMKLISNSECCTELDVITSPHPLEATVLGTTPIGDDTSNYSFCSIRRTALLAMFH